MSSRAARAYRRRLIAAGPRRGTLRSALVLMVAAVCAVVAIAQLLGAHDLVRAAAFGFPIIAGGFTPGLPANLDVAVSSRLATADPAVGRIDVATSTRASNADMQTVLARLPNVGFSAVQYGSVTLAAAAGSGTGTITSVDATKSCVLITGVSSVGATATYTDTEAVRPNIVLTNATTVTVSRAVTSVDVTVAFVVIYWATANSVQNGTLTLAAVATNTATITSVNVAKAIVFHLGEVTQTAVNNSRDEIRITLTNATTITGTKGDGTGTAAIRYVVVEMQ